MAAAVVLTASPVLANGVPDPPQGVAARPAAQQGTIDVTWDVPADPEVIGWIVERSVSGTGPFATVMRVSTSAHRDGGLVPGRRYHYRVLAVDDDSTVSEPSAVVSAIAPAAIQDPDDRIVTPDPDGTETAGDGTGAEPPDDGATVGPPPDDGPREEFDPDDLDGLAADALDGTADDSAADDAFEAGDLAEALGRTATGVAENVPRVARTFTIALVLAGSLGVYLALQRVIGREVVPAPPSRLTGGEGDDVEYRL